jgi:hypothetical protein
MYEENNRQITGSTMNTVYSGSYDTVLSCIWSTRLNIYSYHFIYALYGGLITH